MSNEDKIRQLAQEVMKLAQSRLVLNFRFLDTALDRLPLNCSEAIETQATDGKALYFNPIFVLKEYRDDQARPVHNYMHSLLHCVLYHPFSAKELDRELWDLASDIAVSNTILELKKDSIATNNDAAMRSHLNTIQKEVKILTAEKIYRHFLANPPSDSKLQELRDLFTCDEHSPWYPSKDDQASGAGDLAGDEASSSGASSQSSNGDSGSQPSNGSSGSQSSNDGSGSQPSSGGSGSPQNGGQPSDDNSNQSGQDNVSTILPKNPNANNSGLSNTPYIAGKQQALLDMWMSIAEKMLTDLKTTSKGIGDSAGSLIQNLTEVTRERYDYSEFLKKFATFREEMKVSPDEFDYVYYTYGLDLYKNMPLIEPLEYREVKKIHDFVIAIDVSGSVHGPLVQAFMNKTYNILMQKESFFNKINLHIIQCDTEIQSDVKITSREEFEDYIKHMQLKGFGGTDFRPVFTYVDKLIKSGELHDLKGLIYFTDCMGQFPAKPPEYKAAFVMIRGEYDDVAVPSWAIKLVLDKYDL